MTLRRSAEGQSVIAAFPAHTHLLIDCSVKSHVLSRFLCRMFHIGKYIRLFRSRNSCQASMRHVGLVELLPANRYSVDSFHNLILQEFWVLTERKILLKPVLGARILALSISSHQQHTVFESCMFF